MQQIDLVSEIKQRVPGIGEEMGKKNLLKFLARDWKEIEELDMQHQYDVWPWLWGDV